MHHLAKHGLNVGCLQRLKSLNTWYLAANTGWGSYGTLGGVKLLKVCHSEWALRICSHVPLPAPPVHSLLYFCN